LQGRDRGREGGREGAKSDLEEEAGIIAVENWCMSDTEGEAGIIAVNWCMLMGGCQLGTMLIGLWLVRLVLVHERLPTGNVAHWAMANRA
jgi:hypothetical protein